MTELSLAHGLAFEDLYARDGLAQLDAAFVEHLKEADVGLHNRLMTARAQASDVQAGMEAGADTYIIKPFGPIELREHVENLLNHGRGVQVTNFG